MQRHILALVLALGLAGCGDDDTLTDPATGKVGGADFKVTSAIVDYSRSDADEFAIDLYATAVTCASATTGVNRVMITAPRRAGDHAIGDGVTSGTFSVPASGDRFIAAGHVQISQISASKVRGGVQLHFDNQNLLDGQFEATVCQ